MVLQLGLEERELRRLGPLEVATQGCDAEFSFVQAVSHVGRHAGAALNGPFRKGSRPIDQGRVARGLVVVEEGVAAPGQPAAQAGVAVGVVPGVLSSSPRESLVAVLAQAPVCQVPQQGMSGGAMAPAAHVVAGCGSLSWIAFGRPAQARADLLGTVGELVQSPAGVRGQVAVYRVAPLQSCVQEAGPAVGDAQVLDGSILTDGRLGVDRLPELG